MRTGHGEDLDRCGPAVLIDGDGQCENARRASSSAEASLRLSKFGDGKISKWQTTVQLDWAIFLWNANIFGLMSIGAEALSGRQCFFLCKCEEYLFCASPRGQRMLCPPGILKARSEGRAFVRCNSNTLGLYEKRMEILWPRSAMAWK